MSKKITVRLVKVNRNGKDRFVIQKIVFKFLFIKLWETMMDPLVKAGNSPMEFKTLEKGIQRLNSL